MFRRSGFGHRAMWQLMRLQRSPPEGYQVIEVANDAMFTDFLNDHRQFCVLGILFADIGGGYSADAVQMGNRLTGTLHNIPMGDPKHVRVALLPASRCEKLMAKHNVIALPTSLVCFDGEVRDRIVGFRPREISTKCRFLLRNEGLNVFSTSTP